MGVSLDESPILTDLTLQTERLTLSPVAPSDADDICRACQDPEISHWTPVPSPYTAADAEWFVEFARAEAAAQRGVHWAIRARDEFVGVISLTQHAGAGELGFWLAASARGTGYLTEAGAEVIDHGFAIDGMQLDRIEWNAVVGNTASAKVARALGFQYEGLRRCALVTAHGRADAWVAGLLYSDNRKRTPWPIAL